MFKITITGYMKAVIYAFFILVLVVQVQAQNTEQLLVDSLKTKLKTVTADSAKVNILNALSEHEGWRVGDSDLALDHATQALRLAKKANFKNGEARSYNNIANGYSLKHNFPESHKNYAAALNIYRETGNKAWQGRVLVNIAITYDEQANYPMASESYQAALKVLKEINDQYYMAQAFSGLAFIQYKQGMNAEAILNNQQAHGIYKKIGNHKEIARIYKNMGEINLNKGDLFEAFDNFSNALVIYKELDDLLGIANCYSSIGAVHNLRGDYPEALKNYFAALKIYEENNIQQGIAYSLGNISVIYTTQANYSEALKNGHTALKVFEEMGDKNGIGNMYGAIGDIYVLEKDYPKALESYSAALKIFEEIGIKLRIANCYTGIGSVYYLQKDYTKSLENHFTSLKIAKSIGDKVGMATCYGNIGAIYIKLNRAAQAKEWLEKGFSLSVESGFKSSIQEGYKYLAKADSALGDYRSAYKNYKLYVIYKDSIHNEENTKKLTETSMQYDFDKKDAIAKAEQEKRTTLAAQKLRGQKNIRNGFIGGFGVMMVFAAVFWRQRNRTKKERIRAEQSEQIKQQFLANMSHEIRTPMNAIIGMTNLVLESPLNEKQKSYLTGVSKSSQNLLRIINDILDFSKVESGKLELENIDFSVRETVEQVATTLRHKAEEKDIEILYIIAPDVPEVLIGDPVRLYQVLLNLSGNAVKFTAKGSVQLEVTKVSENGNIPRIKFSIIDTGIGIPADKINSVFESFSQAHSSDTRKYGGTGLGLSISKQLVELMGGRITIESEWGSGSTFSFIVDLPQGSAENLQKQAAMTKIDGSTLNGLRILLADDNADNRIVASDTLKSKADVFIVEAVNGQEVLDILAAEDFDIVLMDVQMPVMDGLEATQKIRSDFPFPKKAIPIIALTASVIRSDLDKCRAAGMDDYVPKPFTIVQLIDTIAKQTGREVKFLDQAEKQTVTLETESLPIVDLSYLKEFCDGNPSKMRKYINIFLDSVPLFIQKLETALVENDFGEIAGQVHGFKTKFVMMGMDDAKKLASQIEMDCRMERPNLDSIYKNTLQFLRIISNAAEELKKRKID